MAISVKKNAAFGMLCRRHDRPDCRTVTLQLVCDQAKRNLCLTLQEFAKETFRRTTVAPRLDEDVDHVSVLIHGTPEILPFTVDRDEDFVQGIVNLRNDGRTCAVWVQVDHAAVTDSQAAKERVLNIRW